MKAGVKTCTGARDLSEMLHSLLWKVFKNEVASWFRAGPLLVEKRLTFVP